MKFDPKTISKHKLKPLTNTTSVGKNAPKLTILNNISIVQNGAKNPSPKDINIVKDVIQYTKGGLRIRDYKKDMKEINEYLDEQDKLDLYREISKQTINLSEVNLS